MGLTVLFYFIYGKLLKYLYYKFLSLKLGVFCSNDVLSFT